MPDHHGELPTFGELDRDGALYETACEALEVIEQREPVGATRADFFKRGGLIAAGGVALGAVPIAFATAQGGLSSGDVKILNYALTLEFLEAAFYAEANQKGQLTGIARTFSQVVGQHEQAHVEALQQTLGSKAVKTPKFDFKNSTSKSKFLATAQVLEDTGVSAYEGQVDKIKAGAVLAAAGSILSVEARHAAWVRDIRGIKGELPAPDAFDKALSMDEVLEAVEGTGFIKS